MTDPEPAKAPVARWIWWAGAAVTCAAAVTLTVLAYLELLPEILGAFQQADKVLHFAVAGGLVFFLDGALRRHAVRIGRIAVPLSCLVVLVPAAIEEYLQRYAAVRTSSIWDYLADVAGALVFLWLSRRVAA